MKKNLIKAKEAVKKIYAKIIPCRMKNTRLDRLTYVYALAGLVIFFALCLIFWFIYIYHFANKPPDLQEEYMPEQAKTENAECEFVRIIDGQCVDTTDEVRPKLVVVAVDNHPKARPQSGLNSARVVYEAPVEGGYTRYMALYLVDDDVGKVGPVRSARPYFLDWLSEYGKPMYMHVGGSPEALELIEEYDFFYINEMTKGQYFWRDESRLAPYNTYTSKVFWLLAFDKYFKQEDKTLYYDGWKFIEQDKCKTDCIDEIKLIYLPGMFEFSWVYDNVSGRYTRYQSGSAYKDDRGQLIKADNIVVQMVETKVKDSVGRLVIGTIGEGKAFIFTGGEVIEGKWKKNSRSERTLWYDENSLEAVLNPGITWVQILGENGKLEWTN